MNRSVSMCHVSACCDAVSHMSACFDTVGHVSRVSTF